MSRRHPSLARFVLGLVCLPCLAFASPPAESYREPTGRIIGAALTGDVAYERLRELCDTIGHRLSGSPQLDEAIDWAVRLMETDGFDSVSKEPVLVPAWVRGAERITMVSPVKRELPMLGLGRSVGTQSGPIEAEVVVAESFDELVEMGEDRVRGRIVLWDVPFTSYGETVKYRSKGSDFASRFGAVASLVRSVGPTSLVTPHTGSLSYGDEVPRIPGAAISIEDASWIHRLFDRGTPVTLSLEMEAHTREDQPSANVVADLRGSEIPEEIVLLSGHLDSWDVGQGAQDDGVGCLIAWEAVRLIRELGLRPRRTLRVVLYTNEENGLAGGTAYREAHAAELHHHVAAFESDSGNGPADGFRVDIRPRYDVLDSTAAQEEADALRPTVLRNLETLAPLLAPLDATRLFAAGSGADIGPLAKAGIPCFGLNHDTTEYFEIHHTHADTFEKIDLGDMNRNIAIMAVLAYVLADMPDRLVPGDQARSD